MNSIALSIPKRNVLRNISKGKVQEREEREIEIE
jgi:hypothetical protein